MSFSLNKIIDALSKLTCWEFIYGIIEIIYSSMSKLKGFLEASLLAMTLNSKDE